jgi:hypothetical protein
MVTAQFSFSQRNQGNTFVEVDLANVFCQDCQIFLGLNLPKRKNIPNDHKIYQTATSYTK